MCLELPQIDEAKGFTRPAEALDWLNDNSSDIALLDIDMPKMNGLVLAAEIKKKLPDIAIILLTGYSQFAVDAFELHALGYLLKPVTKEKLAENIAYALSIKPIRTRGHVFVQTFGNFDVFVDGRQKLKAFKIVHRVGKGTDTRKHHGAAIRNHFGIAGNNAFDTDGVKSRRDVF